MSQGELFPDIARAADAELAAKSPLKSLIPRHPLALRLCAIFKRRLTTPWNARMRAKFIEIRPHIVENELLMIERRYRELWPPDRNKNSLRHDLEWFLSNYGTETDRARIYCEKHPVRSIRKVIKHDFNPAEQWDPEKAAETKQKLAEFRKGMGQ